LNTKQSNTVYIFPGCVTELFSRGTVKNSVLFLRELGYIPIVAPPDLCCGQIAWNAGLPHITKDISNPFLNWLKLIPDNATVVSLSASCVVFVNKYLNKYLKTFVRLPEIRLFEFSQFLFESERFQKWQGELDGDVALHVSCHHLRDLDRGYAIRQVLSRINGVRVLSFENPELCCGFGGIFSLIFPELSNALTTRKIAGLPKNARYLTSADTSCLWKLKQALQEMNTQIKVVHLADLLYNATINQGD